MPRNVIITVDSNEEYEPKDDVCKRVRGPRCTCGCNRPKRECEAFKRMRANGDLDFSRTKSFAEPEGPKRRISFERVGGVWCNVTVVDE